MEIIGLLVILLVIVAIIGGMLGLVSAIRLTNLKEEFRQLRRRMDLQQQTLERLRSRLDGEIPEQSVASVHQLSGDAEPALNNEVSDVPDHSHDSSNESAGAVALQSVKDAHHSLLTTLDTLIAVRQREGAVPASLLGTGKGEGERTSASATPADTSELVDNNQGELERSIQQNQEPQRATVDQAEQGAGSASLDKWTQFEQLIGRQWMTWVGVVVLFVAGGFLAHWGIQQGYVGPWARLIIGLVTAAGCGVAGEWAYRKTYPIIGQGLLALATMLAYVALYASFSPLNAEILAGSTTFMGMVAVTAAAIMLSIRRDARAVAILATIGGYATPVLVSTQQGSFHQLSLYLAILSGGVVAAACYRRWRWLDTIAWVGTVVVFGLGWSATEPTRHAVAGWAMLLWALFTAVPIMNRQRRRLSREAYVMALSQAMWVVGILAIAWHPYELIWAASSVLVGGVYAVLAACSRKVLPGDRLARSGYTALAVAVIGMVGPIILAGHQWVWSFTVQASVLWWLAGRWRAHFLLVYAAIIHGVALLALPVTFDQLQVGSWHQVISVALAGVVSSWRLSGLLGCCAHGDSGRAHLIGLVR